MTLTKKKMVREIGRRTRLTNREVQEVVETLVDVWTEALVKDERIEIENFFVMEVIEIDRGNNITLGTSAKFPSIIRRLTIRASKTLKSRIRQTKL